MTCSAPSGGSRNRRGPERVRVAVYTGYAYDREAGRLYAERAFALFFARLAEHFDQLTIVGGVRTEGRGRYEIPEGISFVELPYYESLASPAAALGGRSAIRFWRALDNIDTVWLVGPHSLAALFAVIAALRRRRVVMGVRQDTVEYVRHRHPRRPLLRMAARLLEAGFRLLGRFFPVIVVGPELAQRYARSKRLLEITVSLVEEADLVPPERGLSRDYGEELRVLTVGRIESEKNPLLLAEILALLNREDPRWRLLVCGEGDMVPALAERLDALGQADRADLLGYVPLDAGLMDLYRESHLFLHNSWTEGFPQVLLEAFAAALPVVATDVGGIRKAVGDAASLVPAGRPDEAVAALRELADHPTVRERRVRAGHEYVLSRTTSVELGRIARFLRGDSHPGS